MNNLSKTKLIIIGLLIMIAALLTAPLWASEYEDCRERSRECDRNDRGDEDERDTNGGRGGGGGSGGMGGSSTGGSVAIGDTLNDLTSTNVNRLDVQASGGDSNAEAAGGSVGDISIDSRTIIPEKQTIKIKNTPDNVTYTPGSGDNCKAHIGANLSLPGLGTGLTIPLPGKECRKLKYYDRMMSAGKFEAAAIIFCSLKEVRWEFKHANLSCFDTVLYVPEPEPVAKDQDDRTWMMAQVTEEEYYDQIEQSETRYAQQTSLIEAQAEEIEQHIEAAAARDAEIEYLKSAEAERVAEESEKKSGFGAILNQRMAKEISDE